MKIFCLVSVLTLVLLVESSESQKIVLNIKTWKQIMEIFENKMKALRERELTIMREKANVISEKSAVNQTVRVIVGNKLPFITYQRVNNKIKLSGYIGELWNTLNKQLKFRSMIKVVNITDERLTLKEFPEHDLILNPVVLRASDLNYFKHTIPLAYTWYHLFLKIDWENGNSMFYISIWRSQLWAAFFITICLLSLILWLINILRDTILSSTFFWTSNSTLQYRRAEKQDATIVTCFLSILSAITNQGVQIKPSCLSVRIISLVSIMFGLVMTTSYSAILISKLATKGFTVNEPTTLDAVAEKKSQSLCVSTTSIAYDHFKIIGSSEINSKWLPILNKPPCTVGTEDLVPTKDYCADDTIVFESLHNTNYMFNTNPGDCRIHLFPRRYYFSYVSVLAQKKFPYTKLISKYLLRFHTSGIVSRLQEQWIPSRTNQIVLNGEYKYTIAFSHIKEILLIYACAICAALLILLIEFIYFMFSTKIKAEPRVKSIKGRKHIKFRRY